MTIACSPKESHTDERHCNLIVAPSHRDSIQNMTTGALQANTAHIMVPADGSFTTVIAKDNHKAGEIQRWTRQYCRTIDLLGVTADLHLARTRWTVALQEQTRATESSPMRRLATAGRTALDAEIRDSAIHVLHQGGCCWSHFSGVRLRITGLHRPGNAEG